MPAGLTREIVGDAAIGVAVTETADGLAAIRKPGRAAAIWRRDVPTGFQAWLDALPPRHLPRGRVVLGPDAARDATRHLCDIAGMRAGPERDGLCDDVAALARALDATCLRLRLDPVDGEGCSRFHVDRVRARLVCTLRGPGTEYGISTDGRPPRRVFEVPTGAPIVLRGTLWPGEPTGLMHRSPPIEGTGIIRLVLVLDVVDDPEDGE
jgi:hypothetical protein